MVKAKKTDSPRVVQTWRIRKDVIALINKLAKKDKKAPSEVIEEALTAAHWYTFSQMKNK